MCGSDGFGVVCAGFVPKGVQFADVYVFFLRIDVPEKGFGGKLGAYEAVFSADNQAV